ncbi:MAG TPA: mucoidy inhibitor MuiA family protein [Oscillatoriaceae cyanobacterium]
MRPRLPLVLALALLPAPFAQAASPTLLASSRIDAVTVYDSGAAVTRSAQWTLAPGHYRLVFDRLPETLDSDTLRVSAVGSAQATIDSFDVRTHVLGAPPAAKVAQLQRQLQALDDQERALKDQHDLHTRQLNLLRGTASASGEGLVKALGAGKANLNQWRDLLAYLEKQQASESESLLKLDQAKRTLDAKRAPVVAELAKLRDAQGTTVYQVPVDVDVTRGGTLKMQLSYQVPDAGWQPTYDARLDATSNRLTWEYRALVHQQTGESWNGVKLALSTAQPAAGGAPPSIPDWFLSIWHPMPMQAMDMAAPKDEAMSAPAPEAAQRRAEKPHVAVHDQGSSITLEVPGTASIPDDGDGHETFVGSALFTAEPGYRVVPKLSDAAFLEVKAKQTGPWPLLPGAVKAFVGQSYVGTTPLDVSVMPGASFRLPMGIDRAVHVKRERLYKKLGQSGLINRVNVADYRYALTMVNDRSATATLTVVEPVPQSTEDAVRVLLDGNQAQTGTPGQVSWTFKLAPHQQRELRWGYRVEYPLNAQLTGLE